MNGFGNGTKAGEGGMLAIKMALLAIKPQRLVFGTDFALGTSEEKNQGMKQFIDNLRKLSLPPKDIEAMLSGNARELFGI